MIVVLHGDDTSSSYHRLTQFLEGYKNHHKIKLNKAQEYELEEIVFSRDLISEDKVIIAENTLSTLKKLPDFLKRVPEEIVLIFWEKTQLTPAKLQKLQKFAKLELFKTKSQIFDFLNALFPGSKDAISILQSAKADESILWHLQNRFLLLILYKMDLNKETASKISGRNIIEWQWDKIRFQASRFSLEKLLALYRGALKIDYLIKTGQTQLPTGTLISILLLKYLGR
jgi:hypothetical protein